ncbi:hypothetical protein OROGR_007639 [Orobanche gracilis]
MDDRNASPASSSPSAAVVKHCRRIHRHVPEEDVGDPVACSGKSCRSCTAEVIADCVAVCCCPCGVVNILALAFVKLPWAVARRCLVGVRKNKCRRRGMLEGMRDMDGNSEIGRLEDGTSENVLSSSIGAGIVEGGSISDDFGAEDVWLELELGHLGFGRVSFTGVTIHDKGN